MSTTGDRAVLRVSSYSFPLYFDLRIRNQFRTFQSQFEGAILSESLNIDRVSDEKSSIRILALRRLSYQIGFITALLLQANAQSQYRVVGYYPMWSRATLPASSVKFQSLTHINHAFAWPNADGTIASNDVNVDTALINTTHRAGRKILLAFGGAGATQTANFAVVSADSMLRRTFINNVVIHVAAYHYDGADLDWEGPASRTDKANEVALVRELRTAFLNADTSWLLTMAIGPSNWSGQWRDFGSMLPYIDWFNVMEYDFHGSWSAIAGHNAPLSLGTDPISDPDYFSIEQSIQYLTVTRAIPKTKLTLGIPFYGKQFGTLSLYTPYTGEQDFAYRDIVNTVQNGSWTYTWDSGSKVPYYASVTLQKLITFDDSVSISIKCGYARTQGLAGVMIWEISQDVIAQNQPLLDVIGTQMVTTSVESVQQLNVHPAGFALFENYPNPFNPSTTIRYQIPVASNVTIKVFDVLGREMATLLNEYRNAGTGYVQFDASRYQSGSGVSFYRIQAGTFVQTKKMILVK